MSFMGLFNLPVVLPQLVSSSAVGDIVQSAEYKTILMIICTVTVAFSAVAWFMVKELKDEQTENPVLFDE